MQHDYQLGDSLCYALCKQHLNGCFFWSVDSFHPQSTSPSVPQLCTSPISHTHAGASGHTVSLLAVTVVLVLECSTGGEGDWVDTQCAVCASCSTVTAVQLQCIL